MSIVRLRKLTFKSILSGKKYHNRTVEEVLKVDRNYIIYCYYHYSNISFIDDVLLACEISNEYRIEKPGKNPEMRHKFFSDRFQSLSESEKKEKAYLTCKANKRYAKLNRAKFLNTDRKLFSKSNLQNLNRDFGSINVNSLISLR